MKAVRAVGKDEMAACGRLQEEVEADGRIAAAFLFGSAARGGIRKDSDQDLAVVFTDDRARESLLGDMLGALGRLGMAAGRDVHLVDLEAAGHILRFQVFRDGVVLLDRDPGRTADLLERTLIERFDWLPAMAEMDRAMRARAGSAHDGSVRGGTR